MKYCSIALVLSLTCLMSLSSCRTKRLDTENISYLFLDYDSYAQNNIGTQIKGTVSAQMITGEALPLKNNQGFSSSDNIYVKISDEQFIISTRLNSFKENKIPVTFSYTDRSDMTITSNDTLLLNFTGDAKYFGAAERGASGGKGADGGSSLISRDGKDGDFGVNGNNGGNANGIELHVWRSNDTTFFYLNDVVTHYIARFMIIGTAGKLYVDAQGGAGGSGGNGGVGGNGKNGETSNGKTKLPGQGGRGGNGGNGGTGGRGANVVVSVHPSATDIESMLIVYNNGGDGGSSGQGGAAGKAGTPVAGQAIPADAKKGSSGFTGIRGMDGQLLIQTVDFIITNYSN